jgi:hypothetical protein
MFLGIGGPDRKLLIIGGALLVLMIGVSAALSPAPAGRSPEVTSTYSTRSSGAKAAFLLLNQMHYPLRRWQDPPKDLPHDGVLLILADPTETPSNKDQQAIGDFVKSGGHVLFTGDNISAFFPQASISEVEPDPDGGWNSYSANLPSAIANHAKRITMEPRAYWSKLDESQLALYGAADSQAVVSWKFGEGQILWWAGATPLTNAGIARDDNLAFFLNSVANWSEKPYSIYWDEYFHGQRSSLWNYARHPSLSGGLIQIGLLALAAIFTFGRRSGPIYGQPRVSRLAPLEFVDTLGGLYERAGAGSAAVGISQSRLRYLLTRQLRLPRDTPEKELAEGAQSRLGWKNFVADNVLGRAESASRTAKLNSRQALDLVVELERYSQKLEVRTRTPQEKS